MTPAIAPEDSVLPADSDTDGTTPHRRHKRGTAEVSHTAPPLWEHQKEAVRRLAEELGSAARTTAVMACGTGKTRVGAEIAQVIAPGGSVLIVLPTLDLVAQTLSAWKDALGSEAMGQIVAVCGDREVMDREANDNLISLHIEVTSDPVRLAELMHISGRSVVAITYQSLPKLIEAHRIGRIKPWKLIVVDEAHRSAGVKDRKWSVIHDDVLIPASRRLYMTATPRLVTAGDGELSEVVSMDDEKVFGRVGYRLSFAQARQRKLLAGYRVIVSIIDDEQMHTLATGHAREMFLQSGSAAVSAEMLARQVAILRAARELEVQRMLTYHRLVRDARWFSQTLPAADALLGPASDLTTGFVYGSQRRAERRRVLSSLAADGPGRVIISNAKVLSEGYDAPAVDGVAFISARASAIDTVQAVGRALRLGGRSDKTAYIVIPILLAAGQDPASALEDSAYAPVWQVVSALAAHDEDLAVELRAKRRHFGEGGYGSDRDAQPEMPDWLHVTGVPVPPRFARAIAVRAVRATTASWDEYLGAATAYAAEHGNLLVREDHSTASGLALGAWINRVRLMHRDGTLSAARAAQLEALGMTWSVLEQSFARRLAAAAEYRAEHGHLRVHRNYVTPGPEPIQLGRWMSNLRERREKLSPRQRQALDELGMIWSAPADEWRQGIDAARAYRAKNGHLQVPADHVEMAGRDPGGFPLGTWLENKRHMRKQGRISEERIADLDTLGIVWPAWEDAWQRHFTAAQAFHARTGHLKVLHKHIESMPDGDVKLGAWLFRQCAAHEAGRLSAERAAALASLGADLVPPHQRGWQRGLSASRLFHTEFGHLNVPARHTVLHTDGEEIGLGAWISKMRQYHAAGKLSAERVAELDSLGIAWDVNEARWRQHFAAARAYRRANKHLNVPRYHVTDPPEELNLGAWIQRQRSAFNKGTLSAASVQQLTAIGMRW